MTLSGLAAHFARTPQAIVSDADRDQLVERLNQAYTDGSLPEFDYLKLLDDVFAAHRHADLVPIAAALPTQVPYATPPLGAEQPGPTPDDPNFDALTRRRKPRRR